MFATHVSKALVSPKCVEACCAVVSWDADVCVTFVICRKLWFRRNCVEACCAVVPWDGGDHHIELQEMSPNVCRCVFVFGLSQSRTEQRLVHL